MSDPNSSEGPPSGERRGMLLGAKLRGLVADHVGTSVDGEVATHPSGAALAVGAEGWVLVDGPADRQLGGALARALRSGARSLNLIADNATGLLARRAEQVDFPVSIWFAEGRALLPAVAEELLPPLAADPEHLAMADLIEGGGASVNVEHGVVFGEVRGLEVCRVVSEPTVGHMADSNEVIDPALLRPPSGDGVILEVGVGANDREAFRLLHGDVPPVDALRSVVESVRRHRSADAPQHPLNRMARERYLRWRLQDDPTLIGLSHVEPAEPPQPRPSLRESVPCTAVGADAVGRSVRVVCSTGVDLDLVGYVADVGLMSDEEVWVVMPGRDRLPIAGELLDLLRRTITVRTVD